MNTLSTTGLENALFKQNEKLIKMRCRMFAQKHKLPLEGVLSEGYLIFMKATKKYDINNNTKFSTFLYTQLLSLSNYNDGVKRQQRNMETVRLPENIPQPIHKTVDHSAFHLLSKGAREIIDGLLSGAFELVNASKNKIPGKARIEKILKEKGWTRKEVHTTYEEISNWLKVAT